MITHKVKFEYIETSDLIELYKVAWSNEVGEEIRLELKKRMGL